MYQYFDSDITYMGILLLRAGLQLALVACDMGMRVLKRALENWDWLRPFIFFSRGITVLVT